MLAVNQLLQDEQFINGYRKSKSKDLVELEPSFTYEKNGWLAVPTKDGTFIINDAMSPDQIAATMTRMADRYTIAKDYYIPAATRGINPAVADKQAADVSKTKNAEEIMQETGMSMTRPAMSLPVLTANDIAQERERKPAAKPQPMYDDDDDGNIIKVPRGTEEKEKEPQDDKASKLERLHNMVRDWKVIC
eukprot:TRINITY_DN669_c0_g1_i15.p6 TRINITY_DN669_c0_g1~~TRINITY_DN669_c0_g1_i15.p6  ORF type:complete len:191 (-),score=32.71 TRINITY_DN669_c0_g1_i15:3461-4033(-)